MLCHATMWVRMVARRAASTTTVRTGTRAWGDIRVGPHDTAGPTWLTARGRHWLDYEPSWSLPVPYVTSHAALWEAAGRLDALCGMVARPAVAVPPSLLACAAPWEVCFLEVTDIVERRAPRWLHVAHVAEAWAWMHAFERVVVEARGVEARRDDAAVALTRCAWMQGVEVPLRDVGGAPRVLECTQGINIRTSNWGVDWFGPRGTTARTYRAPAPLGVVLRHVGVLELSVPSPPVEDDGSEGATWSDSVFVDAAWVRVVVRTHVDAVHDAAPALPPGDGLR